MHEPTCASTDRGFTRNPQSTIHNRESPAILLVTTRGNQQHIAHCCERAAVAGIVRGMSLAHARALLPLGGVIVEEHDPAHEAMRLKSLASWAIRFAPIVSADPPDGLLLDVTGCERLNRGERRLLNTIANSIEWLGFHTRIASASNFACARAIARCGEHDRFIIRSGDELNALRDLPIEALRLDGDAIDALHEVNIDHIGHLTCLPRSELAVRFGRNVLLRLDQASGDHGVAEEVIEPQRPIVTPRVERAFDGPVKQIEGIAVTVQELIAELCAMLKQIESGVRRLEIDFERIDAENLCETIMLSRPSRDAKHVWSLLRPRVEKVNLGFGVEKISVSASRTARLPHAQLERWSGGETNDAALQQATGELIDTLTNRLGAERITRAIVVESHLPERAFRHESVVNRSSAIRESRDQSIGVDARPTALFDQPEMAEVMSVALEGPPKWIRWRREEHTIIASSGPERIDEEWWRETRFADGDLAARDYFRIQLNDGRWLWLFRRLESGQWFVHGQWA